MSESTSLCRTQLYSCHLELGARMVPFSGWEMPVQYSSINKEHQAVRQQAGMFDISHMGKFVLTGQGAIDQLQKLVPSDLSPLKAGEAQYTVLLNPQGGIVDDLIIYYQGKDGETDQVTIIVNAATTEKDKTWLQRHMNLDGITFDDLSLTRSLIAVQGPTAVKTLQEFVQVDLSLVKRFGHVTGSVLGTPGGFLARTGYTGEDGFEVMVPPDLGVQLWRSLLAAGVVPCGLGARDTLRLEAAMALYGQDITDQTTPLEAGLNWLVHLDRKGEFIGRSVLEQQKQTGLSQRIVGLQLAGRNIARHDYLVMQAGQAIGKVTSGTLSPTLGYPIAIAYVAPELAKIGQVLEVEIRGKTYPATVVKRPFYRAG